MNITSVPCTICQSENTIANDYAIRNNSDPNCKMYVCQDCDTHFLWPLPNDSALSDYYDGIFRTEEDVPEYYEKEQLDISFHKFSEEAKQRVERVKHEFNSEDEILEIGCSTGYFLYAAEPYVRSAYGTEWDSSARAYIMNERSNPKIKASKNPEDFHMKFDKIFMFHVLEHISDPVEYLIRLKPFMKKGAKIYIELPNVDDIMVKTFHLRSFIEFYYKKAHLYNFNEKGLSYVFDKAQFQYDIHYIQRYDISNHFYWFANQLPGGFGAYTDILSDKVNEEYVKSLIQCKQADTLFAVLTEG